MGEVHIRAPRSDATRNRDQLLAVATRVFASADGDSSMRAPEHDARAARLLDILMEGLRETTPPTASETSTPRRAFTRER